MLSPIEEAEIRIAKLELKLVKIEYRGLCQKSFKAFVHHMHPTWVLPWFHVDLIKVLQRVGDGELKRVIISMPPGHAKSTMAQLFMAWFIGRNPDLSNISTSYTDELTGINTKAIQNYIDTDEYHEIFPIYISEKNNKLIKIAGHKGGMSSAGIMGGITGKRATGGILIDDPVKNFKGASSEAQKQTLENEWVYSIRSRTQKETFVLLIMTRWRLDDFAGMRIIEAANNPNADQWEEFRFPLMKIDPTATHDPRQVGDTLWPELGYDKGWALATKESVTLEAWESIYQQNPVVIGGGTFKLFNLRFWYFDGVVPPPIKMANNDGEIVEIEQVAIPAAAEFRRAIQSWDMTFKKTKRGSYVVGGVWLHNAPKMPSAAFLVHLARARVGFDGACDMVRDVSTAWPNAFEKWVEDKANGPGIMDHLQNEIPGIQSYTPRGDKEERAEAASPAINAHNIYIPHPSLYEWVRDYIAELGAFPKGQNDDMVDMTTQAVDVLYGQPAWKVL